MMVLPVHVTPVSSVAVHSASCVQCGPVRSTSPCEYLVQCRLVTPQYRFTVSLLQLHAASVDTITAGCVCAEPALKADASYMITDTELLYMC